jgi:hypothetical protein
MLDSGLVATKKEAGPGKEVSNFERVWLQAERLLMGEKCVVKPAVQSQGASLGGMRLGQARIY